MALAITAALVGSDTPRKVQVVVSGLTVGDSFTVVGVWSGGTWPVRGGTGTAVGTQVVLVDNVAPVNIPVTYKVTTSGATATSGSVTVTSTAPYLLQSLDGSLVATFRLQLNGLPRDAGFRSYAYAVPGRRDPVVVMDVATAESGEFTVRTTAPQSSALRDLLALGGLAVFRTNGALMDLPAMDFMLITRASSSLLGAGTSDRLWSLSYQVVADPQPDEVIPTSTWDDFDAAYSGLTWDSFDTEWAGQTWDLFDRTDWTAH